MKENKILGYWNCMLCLEDLPEGVSADEYQDVTAGFTSKGMQVWCKRHDCNIIFLDFEDHVIVGDTSREDVVRGSGGVRTLEIKE